MIRVLNNNDPFHMYTTIPSTICWEWAWIDHHDGRNVDRAIITLRHVVHVVILYPRWRYNQQVQILQWRRVGSTYANELSFY